MGKACAGISVARYAWDLAACLQGDAPSVQGFLAPQSLRLPPGFLLSECGRGLDSPTPSLTDRSAGRRSSPELHQARWGLLQPITV